MLYSAFPERLDEEGFREALEELEINQVWFAQFCGLDYGTVNRWATGRGISGGPPLWVSRMLLLLLLLHDMSDLSVAEMFEDQ